MAKADLSQKTTRVLKFLMGVRHPAVASKMKDFGFTDGEFKKAWDLMEAASRAVRHSEPVRKVDPKLVKKLDSFENIWFGIAKATLAAHFPKVGAALFDRLSQKTGQEAALTVNAFLDRLREMERGEGRFAADGVAARALLEKRGLTPEVIADVEALRAQLRSIAPEGDVAPIAKVPDEALVHESALWAWYLEWGAIARIAVKDRRHLRGMGFLASKKSGQDGSWDEVEDEGATEGKEDDAAAE